MMVFMGLIFVVVFVFILVGMLSHFAIFGSMVWLIARRASEAAEQRRAKPCGYCGSTLLPEATMCGACGAPRDPRHVVSPATENHLTP